MARLVKNTVFIVLYSLLMIEMPVSSADTGVEENTMKAVYSFQFAKFVSWPASKLNNRRNVLGFCIFGANPFGQSVLDTFEGKRIQGNVLHVELFDTGLLAEDALPACHILFVSHSEVLRIQHILKALRYQPILTVSDIKGFSAHGGMITLIKSGEQIQFEINTEAATQAGLLISSKLLELATVVRTIDLNTP